MALRSVGTANRDDLVRVLERCIALVRRDERIHMLSVVTVTQHEDGSEVIDLWSGEQNRLRTIGMLYEAAQMNADPARVQRDP